MTARELVRRAHEAGRTFSFPASSNGPVIITHGRAVIAVYPNGTIRHADKPLRAAPITATLAAHLLQIKEG